MALRISAASGQAAIRSPSAFGKCEIIGDNRRSQQLESILAMRNEAMNLNGHSVLVVEDDQDINHLVGAYVELCGFEYRAALNGARALEEAHTRKPALVILDLMLPDFDGFEVCKRLKSADD